MHVHNNKIVEITARVENERIRTYVRMYVHKYSEKIEQNKSMNPVHRLNIL